MTITLLSSLLSSLFHFISSRSSKSSSSSSTIITIIIITDVSMKTINILTTIMKATTLTMTVAVDNSSNHINALYLHYMSTKTLLDVTTNSPREPVHVTQFQMQPKLH